jgi:hypothetical protein
LLTSDGQLTAFVPDIQQTDIFSISFLKNKFNLKENIGRLLENRVTHGTCFLRRAEFKFVFILAPIKSSHFFPLSVRDPEEQTHASRGTGKTVHPVV